MERIVEQTLLYDFYGELLNEHQRNVYEDVVFNDLSLSEIADEYNISRPVSYTHLVKETFPLLKACDDINFIGSIEAREIPRSGADVIVCDAFVGNVILKLYEGLAGTIISKIKGAFYSNLKSKIGAMLVKDSIKSTLKTMDASEYGGAPLIGLNGLVVKTHGSAKACLLYTSRCV